MLDSVGSAAADTSTGDVKRFVDVVAAVGGSCYSKRTQRCSRQLFPTDHLLQYLHET